MSDIDKTMRERLLKMEMQESISARILRQSLLEAEGRLSARKRVENGILAAAGLLALTLCLISLYTHYRVWWYKQDDNIVWMAEVLGIPLCMLWVAITGWLTATGRSNDRWHPPLKAAGIAGSLFMLVVIGIWWLTVPYAVAGFESATNELWRATARSEEMLILVAFVGLAPMLLVCVGMAVAVYWRVCRESARTREKILETQCMIAELMEKKVAGSK
jgi:hypothetical protein